MDYRDCHVVVTGGTGALGSAVVAALVEAGAVCHVPYRVAAEAEHFPLRDHVKVKLVAGIDLTDEAAVAGLYGGLPALWASIDLDLVTAFLSCAASVNAITRTGVGGRIVNVAARPALEWRSGAGMAAYTASKAGVAALTAALAEEVVKSGILVNAVAPSIMDTPANRAAMPQADYSAWPKVAEVAATILFLASPENKVTRGGVVPVYGRS